MPKLFTPDDVWIPLEEESKNNKVNMPAGWDNLPPWDHPDGRPVKKELAMKVDTKFIDYHARELLKIYMRVQGVGNNIRAEYIYAFACHMVMCGKTEYENAIAHPNVYVAILNSHNYHPVAKWCKLKL